MISLKPNKQRSCYLEEARPHLTKKAAGCFDALLQSGSGIGGNLCLTILYEIGQIERFLSVQDFL